MDFGAIIKRAWQITWRYKALWVLGIFAGVSGCQGGGSSGGSSGGSGGSGSSSGGPDFGDMGRFYDRFAEAMPLIVAGILVLAFIGILWSVFALAARGGLVTGVNRVEEGVPFTLGELWSSGFSRFWTLVGLDILLSLPLFAVSMLMLVFILVPIVATITAGGEPGPELIAPVCGSLAIGVPLLAVGGFILGVMHLIAVRYVMLGGQGAMEAAGNSWRFFRARFKDTLLMWLLNAALNVGASFVIAIPAVAVGIAVAIPAALSASSGDFSALFVAIPVLVVVVLLIGTAYSAIWGTFTSALWTLFFRRVQGMGSVEAAFAPAPEAPTGYAPAPEAPAGYAPAPQPPAAAAAQEPAPPIADLAAPPQPPAGDVPVASPPGTDASGGV